VPATRLEGRFKDKVVLITGAAGGIGRAAAVRFAAEARAGGGVIVNTASIAGLRGLRGEGEPTSRGGRRRASRRAGGGPAGTR